jgi:hypothetical protein
MTRLKLTPEEQNYFSAVQRDRGRCYPKWVHDEVGFTLYRAPRKACEYVFRQLDGHYLTGHECDGTERTFDRLSDAFAYAEFLLYRERMNFAANYLKENGALNEQLQ